MYLVHVYPRHIFEAHLIIYLYPRASLLFHSFPRTNTCGCISVHSNTCHIHRPSHPPVRCAVQIRNVIITQFSSLTFYLLHTHVCFSKGMSTAVNPFVPYFWLVMFFNTLCLCDTLYFKFDEGEIKQDTINKYWGETSCNYYILSYSNFRKFNLKIFPNICYVRHILISIFAAKKIYKFLFSNSLFASPIHSQNDFHCYSWRNSKYLKNLLLYE